MSILSKCRRHCSLLFLAIAVYLLSPPFMFCVNSAHASADRRITGVIIVQGPGSLRLKNDTTEIQIHTGKETQFVPADYRTQLGDTVRIEYYQKKFRNGTTRIAAKKLELVAKNPSKPDLTSPATGKIIEVGRKWLKIHIDSVGDVVLFEKIRGTKFSPSDWQPTAGDEITVTFNKIPSRFGNLYANQILSVEKMQ